MTDRKQALTDQIVSLRAAQAALTESYAMSVKDKRRVRRKLRELRTREVDARIALADARADGSSTPDRSDDGS